MPVGKMNTGYTEQSIKTIRIVNYIYQFYKFKVLICISNFREPQKFGCNKTAVNKRTFP